jgi:hypothetical protein
MLALGAGLLVVLALASSGAVARRITTRADHGSGIVPNGPSVVATVSASGQVARLPFDATAGLRAYLDVESTTLPDGCDVLRLEGPDHKVIAAGCLVNRSGGIDGTLLPSTGTYTIVVDPSADATGVSRLRLSLSKDVSQPITADGPSVLVAVGIPGQVARLGFSGTAGEKVFVDIPSATLPDGCDTFELVDSHDHGLATGCTGAGVGDIDTFTLPATDAYAIRVDPALGHLGRAYLRLSTVVDQTLAVTVDGPAVTASPAGPGAVSRLTFAGIAGQTVAVDVTNSMLPDGCGVVSLLDPAGRGLAVACTANGTGTIAGYRLPVTGTYAVLVNPPDRRTGTVQIRVHST